jgi:3'(2'), 5'-bisphosphate nucleotidase
MLDQLLMIADGAAREILAVYNGDISYQTKDDGSPLTEADTRANEYIKHYLRSKFPEIPILSEESQILPWSERKEWKRFFLVDPLDGTKEFLKRNGEFTVNIALIENGVPVCGIVQAPALNTTYYAKKGIGAYKKTGQAKATKLLPTQSTHTRVVGSRTHASPQLQNILSSIPGATLVSSGSSLKFCMIAEGSADIYPRHGPTSLWDTAAGHCIVNCVGGVVVNQQGEELSYGTSESLINPAFVAGIASAAELKKILSL